MELENISFSIRSLWGEEKRGRGENKGKEKQREYDSVIGGMGIRIKKCLWRGKGML